MLRSGSTLQYNLAAEALEAAGAVERVGFLGDFGAREIQAALREMRDAETVYILKTHEAPLEPGFYTDRVKVLFTYRDLRDIAASIRKKWDKNFDEILSDLDAMVAIHTEIETIGGVLIQPYARLYQTMPEALDEITCYLGAVLTPQAQAGILDRNALERVSQRLSARRRNPILSLMGRLSGRFRIEAGTELHTDHISETGGRNGDWMNQLSDREIECIQRKFSPWLKMHNFHD
jgi:hypothetical protein